MLPRFLRIPLQRVNWTTSLFLVFSALIAAIGAPLYIWSFGLDVFQVSLFAFYTLATGLSITLGYHRLFAHRAFQARRPVKLFTLLFGACAFENSALDWASDHREHHKEVDHDGDPYNIKKGFFWAHIGWLFFKIEPRPNYGNVKDLLKDRLVMWQQRHVQQIAVVVGLVLPAGLGFLWNGWSGALGGFLLAGVTRVVVVQHCTFFINSLCHTFGRRPYDSRTSARDSTVMAFLTFGEGYHNYHHTFQHDYRNGVSRWSFDPTKWCIWLLNRCGLVSNLRRVSPERIVLAEMREVARQAEERLANPPSDTCAKWTAAAGLLSEYQERLAGSYAELKEAVDERLEVCPVVLERWRGQVRDLLRHLASLTIFDRSISPASA